MSAVDDALQLVNQAPERRQEQILNRLHLDYLTTAHGTSSSNSHSSNTITASARRFLCCRMLNDTIYATNRGVGEAKLSDEQLSLLLVQHRRLQDSSQAILGEVVASLRSRCTSFDRGHMLSGWGLLLVANADVSNVGAATTCSACEEEEECVSCQCRTN